MKNKSTLTNASGECPLCQSQDLEFDSAEIDDLCVNYPWECETCGARGTESYDMEFNGHYNIRDKGGKEIKLD